MPRAVWSGSLAFGLVTIPVGLHSATESTTIHVHQLQKRSARLDRLSHEELRARAEEADIAGRSKMTTSELIEALRAAS